MMTIVLRYTRRLPYKKSISTVCRRKLNRYQGNRLPKCSMKRNRPSINNVCHHSMVGRTSGALKQPTHIAIVGS